MQNHSLVEQTKVRTVTLYSTVFMLMILFHRSDSLVIEIQVDLQQLCYHNAYIIFVKLELIMMMCWFASCQNINIECYVTIDWYYNECIIWVFQVTVRYVKCTYYKECYKIHIIESLEKHKILKISIILTDKPSFALYIQFIENTNSISIGCAGIFCYTSIIQLIITIIVIKIWFARYNLW